MAIAQTTAHDVVQRLLDYQGSDSGQTAYRVAVRSLQAALRELPQAHRWSYLLAHGRVHTVAPYSTGTVAYVHTGGAVERQLTLSSGTWPTWALYGALRIGDVVFEVAKRVSGTVLQLDADTNPGPQGDTNIPSGTAYTIYRDTYTLPTDFSASAQNYGEGNWFGMTYCHPSHWLRSVRFYNSSASNPYLYTFVGDPKVAGRMAVKFFPYPDAAKTVDFVYHRLPRAVTTIDYSTGTATSTASSTTLTGTGTAWTSAMAGSVLRLYSDATQYPTDLSGSYPYVFEGVIASVESATSLTLVDAPASTYTAVKYRISDPIDLEQGATLDAYFRCAEKHVAAVLHAKDRAAAESAYAMALEFAREADSRSFAGRVAGGPGVVRQRLADMPRGSDVS